MPRHSWTPILFRQQIGARKAIDECTVAVIRDLDLDPAAVGPEVQKRIDGHLEDLVDVLLKTSVPAR